MLCELHQVVMMYLNFFQVLKNPHKTKLTWEAEQETDYMQTS